MKFIKDILTVNHESAAGNIGYILAGAMFLFGSGTALHEDKCTIERIVQLHPAYIVSCAVMGKTLPTFEIGGKE